MRVLLRDLNVTVSEDVLHDGERHATLHEPRSARVPERVEGDAFGELRKTAVRPELLQAVQVVQLAVQIHGI